MRGKIYAAKVILLFLLIFVIINLIFWQLHITNENVKLNATEIEKLKRKYEAHVIPDLGYFGMSAEVNGTAEDQADIERGWKQYGINVWLSERISLKRKLDVVRDASCVTLNNISATLPAVSVIITYHNEHPSILLRTLHSVYDRTPAKLLTEIILVNDASDTPELNSSDFRNYIQYIFASKVKHIQLATQVGLMRARVTGARAANGEVLVFLDAHVEATADWLPPLLAPIKLDSKTCTTPIIDIINYKTFKYRPSAPASGGFNWDFNYVQLAVRKSTTSELNMPHNNPIMNGGLFAINAAWFWHLGAYDEGLEVWGGEQFELSLKIWTCGGKLLEVPCSRLGHIYRKPGFEVPNLFKGADPRIAIARNYKRVIDVWLDDYSAYIYARNLMLTHISAGDLSKQKALRKQLKCKPFKWFAENIAQEIFEVYPPVEPPDYALGAIRSVAVPNLCLDAVNNNSSHPLMTPCPKDLLYVKNIKHFWRLSFRRNLLQTYFCLEARETTGMAIVWKYPCHYYGGNQFWYYDRQTKMLVHGEPTANRRCLELISAVNETFVYVNDCEFGNERQQWNFGYVNETALDRFYIGIKKNGTV